jgi:hypothetical protein
MVEKPCLLD